MGAVFALIFVYSLISKIMNGTYISIIVLAVSAILPHLGVNLGNEALTTTIETIATVISAIVGIARHQKVVSAARAGGVQI